MDIYIVPYVCEPAVQDLVMQLAHTQMAMSVCVCVCVFTGCLSVLCINGQI